MVYIRLYIGTVRYRTRVSLRLIIRYRKVPYPGILRYIYRGTVRYRTDGGNLYKHNIP